MPERAAAPPAQARLLRQALNRLLSERNDRHTAELFSGLRAAGVTTLVLKGVATRHLLQDNARPSGDIDLLVAPGQTRRAAAFLRARGYRRDLGVHSDTWTSVEGTPVDLHRMIPRLAVSAQEAWELLFAERRALTVGDTEVETLSVPAQVVHLAIHPTQDAAHQAIEDLRAAAVVVPEETWAAAAQVAAQLGVSASVSWSLHRWVSPQFAAPFGPPTLHVNAPHEAGWSAFLRSPVQRRERWRRFLRVTQMWMRWNLGRAGRVLTLRSRRVVAMRQRLSARIGSS